MRWGLPRLGVQGQGLDYLRAWQALPSVSSAPAAPPYLLVLLLTTIMSALSLPSMASPGLSLLFSSKAGEGDDDENEVKELSARLRGWSWRGASRARSTPNSPMQPPYSRWQPCSSAPPAESTTGLPSCSEVTRVVVARRLASEVHA